MDQPSAQSDTALLCKEMGQFRLRAYQDSGFSVELNNLSQISDYDFLDQYCDYLKCDYFLEITRQPIVQ